jgi:hypothetical protein
MEALFGLILELYEQLALKSRHTPRSGINHWSFTLRLVHNRNRHSPAIGENASTEEIFYGYCKLQIECRIRYFVRQRPGNHDYEHSILKLIGREAYG